MDKLIIRESVLKDIDSLSLNMRKEDAAEVWSLTRSTPKEALVYSYKYSERSYSAFFKDEIVAMFGIVPGSLVSDKATIWALTSNVVPKVAFSFAKYSRQYINEFLKEYPVLENWVDARYTKSLNWLKWCGAEIEPAEPMGVDGLPFHHIVIRRDA